MESINDIVGNHLTVPGQENCQPMNVHNSRDRLSGVLPSSWVHLAQLPKEFLPMQHSAGAILRSSYFLGTDSPTTHSQALIFCVIIMMALGTQSETSAQLPHWALTYLTSLVQSTRISPASQLLPLRHFHLCNSLYDYYL